MNQQEMQLNIELINLSEKIWQTAIPEIYQAMDGWKGFGIEEPNKGIPFWFNFNPSKKHIMASNEPGGLVFTGLMEDEEWEIWKRKIKQIATQKLGFKVGERELGEVDEE